jgi:hypothetical protein
MDNYRSNPLTADLGGINIGAVVNQFVIKCSEELNFNCIVYDKNNSIIHDFVKKITVQEEIVKQNYFV